MVAGSDSAGSGSWPFYRSRRESVYFVVSFLEVNHLYTITLVWIKSTLLSLSPLRLTTQTCQRCSGLSCRVLTRSAIAGHVCPPIMG